MSAQHGREPESPAATDGRHRTARAAWRRFRHNWAAAASLVVVLAMFGAAVFAPYLHTTSPLTPDYNALLQPPTAHHWFGTDGVGRDQYSRLLFGLRVPLFVGLIGTVVTVVIGSLSGVLAGLGEGILDAALSRLTDLFFAFPSFLLALFVVSLFGDALQGWFGATGRVVILVLTFAAVSWPPLMRVVRSLTLDLRRRQFIEAAQVGGASTWAIVQRHILPNLVGVVLVQSSFIMVNTISTETVLSIFGLGVAPPDPDLGQMIWNGVQEVDFSYWEVLFPSLALVILILSLTFVGDGLRDSLDPRSGSE